MYQIAFRRCTHGLAFTVIILLIFSGVGTYAQENQQQAEDREREAAEQVAKGVNAMHEKQKDVEQGLSWRVTLLPFLGHRNLYNQFHHDEPWDSAHNRSLIAMMPRIYKSRPNLPESKTTYVALISDDGVITQESGRISMANVPDGASNTILFVNAETDYAVTWTRPDDLRFDPEQPFRGLGGGKGIFTAVFVDGSVHQIPTSLDKETMRRLVWRNDGQPVSLRTVRSCFVKF